jgi:hypothetical protein
MTDQQHPISPPLELVHQWTSFACEEEDGESWNSIATQAAQWGADQELEACCEWLANTQWCEPGGKCLADLRAARRPKPPSLKAQALQVLASVPGPDYPRVMTVLNAYEHALIRQALEALPND